MSEAEEVFHLIKELTREEGSLLIIPSPNPDFGGPEMFVEFCPGMSNAKYRFTGESLLDCLRKALKKYQE